jgi:Flp pilus assembly pilin Flp
MPRPDSSVFWNNAFFKDVQGQEAIEYALMVGFAAGVN